MASTDIPVPPRAVKRTRGAAFLVAAGIFLSRIAGLLREAVFAHYFGNSDAADAFRQALKIPNFLQNLFGEGVLSASFIPVYAGLLARKGPIAAHDSTNQSPRRKPRSRLRFAGDCLGTRHQHETEEEAGRVAGAVFAILALVSSVLVLAGVLATPYLIFAIAPGYQGGKRDLTITLVRILFPGAGLLVLSAWCLGILNSHRRFFLSYSVSVLWNIAMIAALVWFGPRTGLDGLAKRIAWASVVGNAAMFFAQLPVVLRLVPALRIQFATHLESVRIVIRNFGPVFVSRGVVQLSAYVDSIIASYLGRGAFSALVTAQTIYLMPVSLFGMSIAASELPEMSRAVGAEVDIAAKLRQRLVNGLRNIAFFVIPSVVAFMALGDVIAGAIYQSGRFTHADTIWEWGILAGSGVGLLASTQGRLYSSAFYALKDTRTPLRFAIVRISLTTVLGYLCAIPLPPLLGISPRWGVAGLTASAGVSGWVEFLLLRWSLARRIGSDAVGARYLARLWIAAVVAGAVAYAIKLGTAGLHPKLVAVLVLMPYGMLYLVLAEGRNLRNRIRSLVRRS